MKRLVRWFVDTFILNSGPRLFCGSAVAVGLLFSLPLVWFTR